MKNLIKDEAQVRLWLIRADHIYPICINDSGFMQVVEDDVAGEIFTLIACEHPAIGGDVAYEIHTESGKQITGAGGNALQEASELLPWPVPAFRIVNQNVSFEHPRLYGIQLQTLDSRFVSANDRVGTTSRVKRSARSWSDFFSISPYKTVTRYHSEPGLQLRMLETEEAQPGDFLLEWIDTSAVGEQ